MQSIGDFAESLITSQVSDIKEGKALPVVDSNLAEPGQRDVSRIEVPDTFSSQILRESFEVKTKTPPVNKVPQESEPEINYEPLLRLNSILSEAQDILENLGTTAGSIGIATLGKKGGTVPKKEPKVSRNDPKDLRKRLKALRGRNK
jgi:hypothetical protein